MSYTTGYVFKAAKARILSDRPWSDTFPPELRTEENSIRRIILTEMKAGDELEVIKYDTNTGAIHVKHLPTGLCGWADWNGYTSYRKGTGYVDDYMEKSQYE